MASFIKNVHLSTEVKNTLFRLLEMKHKNHGKKCLNQNCDEKNSKR